MPACASISDYWPKLRRGILFFSLLLAPLRFVHATDGTKPSDEVDEFSKTPYTEYGEFNEEEDEENTTRFFQYGRFFGVSVGGGYQGVTGNRGVLWQGGSPLIELKLHVWLDFNFALQMGFYTVKHHYEFDGTATDVGFTRLGLDLKYYFDVKNSSSALSFSNPFLVAGIGSYRKTERDNAAETTDNDNSFGPGVGAGLEFPISYRKVYLNLEGKYHFLNFKDTNTTRFNNITPDLTGGFYTFVASVLFTW